MIGTPMAGVRHARLLITAATMALLLLPIREILKSANRSTTAAPAATAAADSAADPATQLPQHTMSSSAQLLHTPDEPRTCSEYGRLLDGIDVYVIEMPSRSGAVHKQMTKFGVPCCVKEIPTVTPTTILDGANLTTVQLAEECDRRVQAAGKQDPRFGPFQVSKTAFANLLSHIKAFKAACDDANHKDVLVILEDDTQLEPMHFWPMSLVEMLQKLPPTWRIV
eukprot:COSAG05_NODE_7527_length_800_cov_2.019971_2_plen_223_part_01